MRDQGNRAETGRVLWKRCEVERVETKHRQEVGGLWRCVSCGFAEGEVFRTETGRVITDEDFERLADADEQGWGEPDDSGG